MLYRLFTFPQKERLRTLRQRMEISYDGNRLDHQVFSILNCRYPIKKYMIMHYFSAQIYLLAVYFFSKCF